jgi:hypothetical protein
MGYRVSTLGFAAGEQALRTYFAHDRLQAKEQKDIHPA